MLKWKSFILFLSFFAFLLPEKASAQSPVILNYNNPISMGMGANGVGWKDSVSSLYNNPGFLNLSNSSIADLGSQVGKKGEKESSIQLGGLGGYYSYSSVFGFWGVYNQRTSNHFPGDEKAYLNQGNLGLSYKVSENLAIAAGIGPGGLQRYQSYSPWSVSGYLSLAFQSGNWSMGSSFQYLGKYRRDDYRGSEKLKETLPEVLCFGLGYSISEEWVVYSEIRKVFWEKSQVIASDVDVTPDYERGIGPEWSGSYSLQKKNFFISQLDLRLGNEWGGIYLPDGRINRALGLSLGSSYHWNLGSNMDLTQNFSEKISIHIGILDYALTANSNSREKETLASFSISYQKENTK